jgi:hypothetical protein
VRSARRVVAVPAVDWYPDLKSFRSAERPLRSPVTLSRLTAASMSERKKSAEHPSLVSVAIGEGEKSICYNCGKKGHWFMDCLVGCGRCGGGGHRTIDCEAVKQHIGLMVKEEMEVV